MSTRPMMTHVSALRSTMEYVERELDAAGREAILAALPPAERKVVEGASAQEEVPYEIALHLLACDRQQASPARCAVDGAHGSVCHPTGSGPHR